MGHVSAQDAQKHRQYTGPSPARRNREGVAPRGHVQHTLLRRPEAVFKSRLMGVLKQTFSALEDSKTGGCNLPFFTGCT